MAAMFSRFTEVVSVSSFVRGLAAHAGYFALFLGVHGREATVGFFHTTIGGWLDSIVNRVAFGF